MNRFEIWRAKVRFEGIDQVKERPVLIWNDLAYIITAYKLTGTDRGDNEREYRIEYWQESGLSKPTSVRISKVLQLRQTDLVEKMGVLDRRDQLKFSLRIAR